MSIEAMKQALEALKRLNDIDGMYSWVDTEQALRQAIEQAEKQEPVAWLSSPNFIEQETIEGRPRRVWFECNAGVGIPFYTALPKREWVGLTDDEINDIAKNYALNNPTTPLHFTRAIEAKLRERNT